MKADLHVHSTYSDGSQSMEDVMRDAKAQQLTHISFVDHDTTSGQKEAQRLGELYGIKVIPGIEMSAYDFKRDRKVHILGYHYDEDAVHIKQLCDPLLSRRHEHTLWQIEQIKRAGYELDLNEIIESAKPSYTVYKQHVMKQLTNEPYTAEGYQTLYRKLFKADGPASGEIEYIDAFDAVEAIVADGGIAVVAHPGQLDSFDLIPELVEVGLAGIERHHADHNSRDIQRVDVLAERYQLILTGGSDYHGAFGAPIELGQIVSPINRLLK